MTKETPKGPLAALHQSLRAGEMTRREFTRKLRMSRREPTDAQPLGVVVRPGTPQYAYLMSNFSTSVTGFDLSTGLQVPGGSVTTLGPGATQTAVLHPNGNFLFVSSGDVFSINHTAVALGIRGVFIVGPSANFWK